jgi:hypothetical protein
VKAVARNILLRAYYNTGRKEKAMKELLELNEKLGEIRERVHVNNEPYNVCTDAYNQGIDAALAAVYHQINLMALEEAFSR